LPPCMLLYNWNNSRTNKEPIKKFSITFPYAMELSLAYFTGTNSYGTLPISLWAKSSLYRKFSTYGRTRWTFLPSRVSTSALYLNISLVLSSEIVIILTRFLLKY
jgi:hypothetical protein